MNQRKIANLALICVTLVMSYMYIQQHETLIHVQNYLALLEEEALTDIIAELSDDSTECLSSSSIYKLYYSSYITESPRSVIAELLQCLQDSDSYSVLSIAERKTLAKYLVESSNNPSSTAYAEPIAKLLSAHNLLQS